MKNPTKKTLVEIEPSVCQLYLPKTTVKTVKALRWCWRDKSWMWQISTNSAISHITGTLPVNALEQWSCTKFCFSFNTMLWLNNGNEWADPCHDNSFTRFWAHNTSCEMQMSKTTTLNESLSVPQSRPDARTSAAVPIVKMMMSVTIDKANVTDNDSDVESDEHDDNAMN